MNDLLDLHWGWLNFSHVGSATGAGDDQKVGGSIKWPSFAHALVLDTEVQSRPEGIQMNSNWNNYDVLSSVKRKWAFQNVRVFATKCIQEKKKQQEK